MTPLAGCVAIRDPSPHPAIPNCTAEWCPIAAPAPPVPRSVYVEDTSPNHALPMLHALARLVFPIAFSFLLIKFAFRWAPPHRALSPL